MESKIIIKKDHDHLQNNTNINNIPLYLLTKCPIKGMNTNQLKQWFKTYRGGCLNGFIEIEEENLSGNELSKLDYDEWETKFAKI